MGFQEFQSDPSGALALLLLDLLLTAMFYGAGPVLFVMIRRLPVTLRFFRNFCVLYTIFVYLLISALYLLSGNYVIPNMAAATIWGVLFYRVCRKKLRKKEPEREANAAAEEPRQIVEVYRSKFSMPSQKVETDKPRKRRKAMGAILFAALVFSLCVNGYQAVCIQNKESTLEQMESNISVYEGKIKQLEASYEDAKERADRAEDHEYFLCSRIGMIVDGSPYYHSYICEVFQNADEFRAHNVEYCRSLGYSKCPQCGWILD